VIVLPSSGGGNTTFKLNSDGIFPSNGNSSFQNAPANTNIGNVGGGIGSGGSGGSGGSSGGGEVRVINLNMGGARIPEPKQNKHDHDYGGGGDEDYEGGDGGDDADFFA